LGSSSVTGKYEKFALHRVLSLMIHWTKVHCARLKDHFSLAADRGRMTAKPEAFYFYFLNSDTA
jgi:hypothetical protein